MKKRVKRVDFLVKSLSRLVKYSHPFIGGGKLFQYFSWEQCHLFMGSSICLFSMIYVKLW